MNEHEHEQQAHDKPLKLGEPYCGNCGHQLTGMVDSSRCPECGRPFVEVLTRGGRLGRRYRSQTSLFGLPLVDVAYGPTNTEKSGRARGIFAFGDRATGLVAVGGASTGIVAVGGRAIGVFAAGGFSIGLVTAWGGIAIGGIVYGGLALGVLVMCGLGVGVVAAGGVPMGLYALGGAPWAKYVLGPGRNDQAALDMFRQLDWFFGTNPIGLSTFLQPLLIIIGTLLAAAAAIGVLAALKHLVSSRP